MNPGRLASLGPKKQKGSETGRPRGHCFCAEAKVSDPPIRFPAAGRNARFFVDPLAGNGQRQDSRDSQHESSSGDKFMTAPKGGDQSGREDRLRIEVDLESAVGKAMAKKRPKRGWPGKPDQRTKTARRKKRGK